MNEKSNKERPYIIIDALNCFLRYYFACQDISALSQPIGGVIGFLKMIHMLVGFHSPSKVFVVWESGGPSSRRTKLFPAYKANKNKIKEIKNIHKDGGTIKDAFAIDEENKINQIAILTRLLKHTPICQIFVQNTECDDVIGYLIRNKFKTDTATKIIVSNDKDFYQLLDDKTVKIYDPAKKSLVEETHVLKQFNISPRNFCLAKSIAGDASDNISGVPGIGFKILHKRFEELADTTKDVDVNDIIKKSKSIVKGLECEKKIVPKTFISLLEAENIIRRNWKLIYLNSSNLSASQIAKIDYIVEQHSAKMNKLEFIKAIIENGINVSFDYDLFCSQLRSFLR